ncbi:MAG: ABC transporter permease [Leptolyngbya sp. SIOISBB]|nr:ABC transporter permease [Leptolyngbya sp. SIOISBB]
MASAKAILKAGKGWALVLPLTLFLVLFYLSPIVLMVITSLSPGGEGGGLNPSQYVKFFGDGFNLKVLWETVWLGIKTTLVCLLLGYPLALLHSRTRPGNWRSILTFLIVLPLLTSAVVRTFAWIVILGRQGVINSTLLSLSIIEEPIRLLSTHHGVVAALSQIQMPLMILPLIASMARLDPNLESASASLGGASWRTFWRITFPLTLPGIISGSLLVFSASVSSFITPSVIGGGRIMFMPMYIYQQAISLFDFPFAATISTVLLVTVLLVVVLLSSLGRLTRSYTHT